MVDSQQQRIQQYYDATTSWFLRFGSTQTNGNIHRALFIPTYTVSDPTHTIHHLIADSIREHCSTAEALLDVGCGVGSSVRALEELLPELQLVQGITLSVVQAGIANMHGLDVLVASYHALPQQQTSVDVVIAIESYVHSDQPELFWKEVRRVLRPGGILIICDDMLCGERNEDVSLFQRGWHAPNLNTAQHHHTLAERWAFRQVSLTNLNAYLRLLHIPTFVMQLCRLVHPFVASIPLISSSIGSIALQHVLASGQVSYTYTVYRAQ